ncbi:MAG: response regulator [Verrucomicrobia bacterium]|nr:response regulator [Verrucomicrobiota bacterium]
MSTTDISKLRDERDALLACVHPPLTETGKPPPASLRHLDNAFAERLLSTSDARDYCPKANLCVREVVSKSEKGERALLEAEIELLTKVHTRQSDAVQEGPFGFAEAAFPVRLRGHLVYCLLTGQLRTRAFKDDELEQISQETGLSKKIVSETCGKVPVFDKTQFDQILDIYGKLRNSLELTLTYNVWARELSGQLVDAERKISLGTLSSGVAHHFNNLLSVILGYSSFVLNREKISKEAGNALHQITEAAQRGRRLTEEILAFAGSSVEEETICHLHETLGSVLSLLQTQMSSNVRISNQLTATNDAVMAPQSDVHQIIFNLLTNAVDGLPEGGELTLSTVNVDLGNDPDQTYIRLEVTDSGEAHNLPRKKSPPEQSIMELAEEGPESLKLSSVYGIVGRLDGTVMVSSAPESGNRVEVLLPTVPTTPGKAAKAPSRRRLAHTRIWLVDDNPTFREMCVQVLTDEGHEVAEMISGSEMQKKWESSEKKPDLLIIDFSMPEYNGLELCLWLKKHGSKTPVVLVSGFSQNQPDIHEALNMRKTYFLQKPFSVPELMDIVTVALGETLIGE